MASLASLRSPGGGGGSGSGGGLLLDGITTAAKKWKALKETGTETATTLMNAVLTIQYVCAMMRVI